MDELLLRRAAQTFTAVDSLRVLGIRLNVEGVADEMIAHREREAPNVRQRHRAFLCPRNSPARERVARLHQTVGASALYGAGMWTPGAWRPSRCACSER